MSGSRPDPAGRLAEQHLGDRLAALVDGELGHDMRDRALAHVATCPKCKAEVDAQRRLKNVFAQAAPPPPSESFLARLQGLPGGGTDVGDGSPLGGGGLPGGLSSRSGVFGVNRGEQFEFGYVPARPHPTDPAEDHGFRIHPVGRADSERSASRGLRFAFVAAGAVSLAALALGGMTTGSAGDAVEARGGSGNGSNVTPARTAGTGAASGSDTARRRQSATPQSAQGQRSSGSAQAASTPLAAPLLPGAVPPGGQAQDVMHPLTTPVVAGAAVMSPLIRPLTTNPPISLTSWSADPDYMAPSLLRAPSPSVSSRTTH
ncbi:zf-HC2 domain-containing protein [Streptomyces sp. NPDC088337]|uniref:anti-sigma factor family protein n=1 Tax=unclassified Streptomyces TaxID=2593676 RepID=UPI0037F930F1